MEQPLHGVGGGTARGGRGRRLPHLASLPTGDAPFAAATFAAATFTTGTVLPVLPTAGTVPPVLPTARTVPPVLLTTGTVPPVVPTARTVPPVVAAVGIVITAVGVVRPPDVFRVLPVLRRTPALSRLVRLGTEGGDGHCGITDRDGPVRPLSPLRPVGPAHPVDLAVGETRP
ncbi:hypothetical protein [Streptomyces coelicoflavus]|uniref:hypothetical protein n=1 Tax=Streptomyces coelicoflavus TaxID=285562 RepID=UPI002E26288E